MNIQITKANVGTTASIAKLTSIRTYKSAGSFRVSANAIAKLNYKVKNKHIAIFVDKEAQTLTIKKVSADSDNAFALGKGGNAYSIGMHNALEVAMGSTPIDKTFNGRVVGDSVIFDLKTPTKGSKLPPRKATKQRAKRAVKKLVKVYTYDARIVDKNDQVLKVNIAGDDGKSRIKAYTHLLINYPDHAIIDLTKNVRAM